VIEKISWAHPELSAKKGYLLTENALGLKTNLE
jgi:hypothetical protein